MFIIKQGWCICTASSDSNSNMDKWLSKLDSSAWMTHIKDILTTACVVAQTMDKQGEHISL